MAAADRAFVLLDRLSIRAWERVLFVECRGGRLAEEAWRRMARGYVCGVDRSRRLIATARRLRGVPGKLEFEVWDGRSIPCRDQWFDHVICDPRLRDHPEPGALRTELRRVTRPGGRIYLLSTESAGSPERDFGGGQRSADATSGARPASPLEILVA